jgi:hypothetical protein
LKERASRDTGGGLTNTPIAEKSFLPLCAGVTSCQIVAIELLVAIPCKIPSLELSVVTSIPNSWKAQTLLDIYYYYYYYTAVPSTTPNPNLELDTSPPSS